MEVDEEQKGCAPFKLGVIDSSKLKKLGWKPTLSIEEGFRRTVEYIESEMKKGKEV